MPELPLVASKEENSEISTKRNNFSWKRVVTVVAIILVIVLAMAGIYDGLTSRHAQIAYASWLTDSHQYYLPCDQIAFYPEVEKAMAKHIDVIAHLQQLGASKVEAHQIKCPNFIGSMYFVKGDLEIQYHTHAQRMAIEKLIGDNFFGIQWRGYKR